MKAIIKDIRLERIDKLWPKHKPQGLGFSDNDAIIINFKLKNKKFSETFYCRLKGDGTLGHSITKASERRQRELQNFIKKYISKDEHYNIRENLNKWKGKTVNIEKVDGSYIIKL